MSIACRSHPLDDQEEHVGPSIFREGAALPLIGTVATILQPIAFHLKAIHSGPGRLMSHQPNVVVSSILSTSGLLQTVVSLLKLPV